MSEWITYELVEVTEKIGSGATPRGGKEAYKDKGISLIRSQNIIDFYFSYNGLAFIDNTQAQALKNVEVKHEDILINITGDSVARVAKVPDKVLPARVNQHVAILRANKEELVPDYLLYYLLNPVIKSQLLKIASDGATRNALTKSDLEELLIKVPDSLQKQKEISRTLSLLDQKIDLLSQQNQTLEELAQTIFKRWFVEYSFPDKDGQPYKLSGGKMKESELGEIPEAWRVGTMGEIIINHDSKRIPLSSNERAKKQGEYPYYGATSIMDYVDSYIFDGRYLLLGEDGSVIDEKGFPILQFIEGKFWVNNHAHVLEAKTPFFTGYLYLKLSKTKVNHIVPGAVQLKINQANLNSLETVIPQHETVKSFEIATKDVINKLFISRKEIQTLTKLRDTLLPKLMSGEIQIDN